MMVLEHPFRLLWLLPWAAVLVVIVRFQLGAVLWLQDHVAARFLPTVTRSTTRSVRWHAALLGLTGALLVVAASGPRPRAPAPSGPAAATIVLVLDASLSMGATDAGSHPLTGENLGSRFEAAKALCRDLVDGRPETRFALVSFSGAAVIHAPPTRDLAALRTLLGTLRYHVYSQSMGSLFSAGLDAVIHMKGAAHDRLEVVLLSDGELSAADDVGDALTILAARGIRVHTIGLGSTEWQSMSVYDLEDVLEGKEDKRVAAQYRTRREAALLERMAEQTGGTALVVEHGDWVEQLLEALGPEAAGQPAPAGGRRSPVAWPLAAFVVCFLVDTLWLSRPRGRARQRPTVLLPLVLLALSASACRAPLWRAHRLNESGIERLEKGEHDAATVRFERSAAFARREHVPTFNLGNTALDRSDLTAAHASFERALVLEPDLTEAYFNDGHTLYLWGEREIDPSGCELDRTRELWGHAAGRFARTAEEAAPWSRLLRAAVVNRVFVEQRLAELEELAEQCPPSSAGGGGGGGGGRDGGPAGGAGEDGEPPPPLTAKERQHIASEIERIRDEASQAKGYRQSRHTQLDPETAKGAGGREVLW